MKEGKGPHSLTREACGCFLFHFLLCVVCTGGRATPREGKPLGPGGIGRIDRIDDQLGEWGRVQLARACRQQHLCSSSNAMETQGSLVSPWGCAQLPIFSPSREYSCSHGAWPTRVSRQTTIILLPSWGRTPGRHCCGRERRLPSWGRTPGRHCCGRERSRKLRWVSSYTLYRMDPENTLYRMCTRGNQYVVYRRTHSIRLHDM